MIFQTLFTYGISRDSSKNFIKCICEHMILGELSMGACQTQNAPLLKICEVKKTDFHMFDSFISDCVQFMSSLVALFDAQKGLLQFIDIFDIGSLL